MAEQYGESLADALRVLGVDRLDPREVRRQYRRLALLHHPDRGGDAELFKRVAAAYQVVRRQFPATPATPATPGRGLFEAFAAWRDYFVPKVGRPWHLDGLLVLATPRERPSFIEWADMAQRIGYLDDLRVRWWPVDLTVDRFLAAAAFGNPELFTRAWQLGRSTRGPTFR